jgi:hypothetical protein
MRFGGRPKEVEQRSYRVAKQLQPGLPPKLIHTALHTGTQPAMVGPDFVPFPRSSLRSTHYGRTRGNAPPNPADDHIMCTFNWNSLLGSREGRLLPRLANQCGCASGQDASRWPTPSVVPLIKNAQHLANPFGCPDQSKPTPSVVPLVKVHRVGQPLRLCP